VILVTGAGGFIGRHVVQALAESAGPTRIRTMWHGPIESGVQMAGVHAIRGSLEDPRTLAVATESTEAVLHLASKTVDRERTGFHRVNVEGTAALCQAAVRAGVRRFVYVSTVGVYGHRPHRDADEDTPVAPDTPYARSKSEAERIVLDHHERGDLRCVVARLRFVYGEGDVSLLPRIIRFTRRFPFLVGSQAKLSLIEAGELAAVLARFALTPIQVSGRPVFHVTDGQPLGFEEMVGVICRSLGYRPPGLRVPFSLLHAPIQAIERVLGIDPEASPLPISSIRLKLVGRDNWFSNRRLMSVFPDLRFSPFREAFRRAAAYYSRFL
jgi:nucleoside-diphosphate-sugar epimerase